MDYAFLNLALTAALLIATFLLRKRLLRALGKMLFAGALGHLLATYFEQVQEVDGGNGVKTSLLRPNAKGEAFLKLALASGVDWARRNVKWGQIAGPVGLPSVDAAGLGQALMGGIAQKVMSGKKLSMEDMLQGALGFFMPRLEGLVAAFGGAAKPGAPAPGKAAPNPFLKELQP